jgi:hypothetical protein
MNEAYELLKSILGGLGVLAIGVIGYFIREDRKEMKARLDVHTERLNKFDLCFVTRDELQRTMSELRADRMEQHHENSAVLARIEHKIDENEERASKTRHDTKDEVHALAMRVALMSRSGRKDD